MLTVLLVCYVSGTAWTPPADWQVKEVSQQWGAVAAVTLTREVKSGDVVTVPDTCNPKAPALSGSGGAFLYNGSQLKWGNSTGP